MPAKMQKETHTLNKHKNIILNQWLWHCSGILVLCIYRLIFYEHLKSMNSVNIIIICTVCAAGANTSAKYPPQSSNPSLRASLSLKSSSTTCRVRDLGLHLFEQAELFSDWEPFSSCFVRVCFLLFLACWVSIF